ncbi:hypothetical protein GGR57DRAFT_505438 [Xylariaceae sp. FL1272]|nr:hypothetical protein GGR57DRAFT_505438 [Xylariaceae sp. FL1272]
MASYTAGGFRNLPRTLKCTQCDEYKSIDQYSKNQIVKWKKADNKSWVQLSCKAHQGALLVAEKRCFSCNQMKPVATHFSKAQRNDNEPWCIACTDWKDSDAERLLPTRPNESVPYFASQELPAEHLGLDEQGAAGFFGDDDSDEAATATASIVGTGAGGSDAVDGFDADGYEIPRSSIAPSTTGDGNDDEHDDGHDGGYGAESYGINNNTVTRSSATTNDAVMPGPGTQQSSVVITGSRYGIGSFSSRMSPPPSVHRSLQTSFVQSTTAATTTNGTATGTRRAHGTAKFHKSNGRKDFSEREKYEEVSENRAEDPDSDDSFDEF